jgi:hypothetical protein
MLIPLGTNQVELMLNEIKRVNQNFEQGNNYMEIWPRPIGINKLSNKIPDGK